MVDRVYRLVLKTVVVLMVLGSGCSGISREWRHRAEPRLSFETIHDEPWNHLGRVVIFGGYILETEVLADKTRIRVLQAPLDLEDAPGSRDRSQGRFLVESPGFFDPEIYRKDRKITVAGALAGEFKEQVGGKEVRYPMVHSGQIILWPDREPLWGPYRHAPFSPYGYWYYPRPHYVW